MSEIGNLTWEASDDVKAIVVETIIDMFEVAYAAAQQASDNGEPIYDAARNVLIEKCIEALLKCQTK